jgi:hypothetical protein
MHPRAQVRPIRCFIAGAILLTTFLLYGHAAGSEETPWRSHENGSAGLNYNNGSDYACGHNSGTASTPLVYIGDLASPVLSFYYTSDTEQGQLYDRRYVEILKWDSTYGVFRWAAEPLQLHGESRNTWHYKEIALDPAWEFVMVRFRFDTGDDFFNAKPGWFIDDLRIGE